MSELYYSIAEDSSMLAVRWSGHRLCWMLVHRPSYIYHYTVSFSFASVSDSSIFTLSIVK